MLVLAVRRGIPGGRLDLKLTEDQRTDPATYTWTKIADTRNRYYCWPMMEDYLKGDVTDAAAGNLSTLGNVGDFNGDGREDITVGAHRGQSW